MADLTSLSDAELDRMAAERMGWQLTDSQCTWMQDDECLMGVEDWQPTKDITQAFELAEKCSLFEDGHRFLIFLHDKWRVGEWLGKPGQWRSLSICDTPARAITLACLSLESP